MPQETNRAAIHLRIGGDRASEAAEEYAEAIEEICEVQGFCRVTDLAKRLGVSRVTVVKHLKRLQNEGIVLSVPDGPTSVTKRGRAIAHRARRRHRIVQQVLLALGADAQTAATDAARIEHHVSEAALAKLTCFIRQAEHSTHRKRSA